MRHTGRVASIVVLLLALVSCVGSPSPPASFYALSMEPGTPVAMPEALLLGVGPVSLPDVLERPQIVTQAAPNQLDFSDYHRWGGDLHKNLSRVLAQNLMQRLATDQVVQYPWPVRVRPSLEVAIDFFRFDGVPGQSARLQGVWRLFDDEQDCQLGQYRFEIEEPLQGGSYQDLVSGLSRGAGQLSDQIARELSNARDTCRR